MFLIYSKSNCPKCVELKQYLVKKGLEYTDVDVEKVPSAKDVLIKGGYRTVPQVFIEEDMSYYGDCDKTISKLNNIMK